MSRPRIEQHREQPADPKRSVLVPITEIPHLAEAAKRLGQTDRMIRVELPEPAQVKTVGREVGQWLRCGEYLPDPCNCPEDERFSRSPNRSPLAGYAGSGNALADAVTRTADREGVER
ncbi:MAG: hypothetical protein JWN03_6677 [Nocardia sp.]|uniref:hypothetical protein n=1 Tax=Nocardia sp. TaxID=1821 RepID=UPI00261200B5|nr:hypothetical protein [Nocardia sp.]MCU1646402.1 hypothetical protein [Nocardia sp.]